MSGSVLSSNFVFVYTKLSLLGSVAFTHLSKFPMLVQVNRKNEDCKHQLDFRVAKVTSNQILLRENASVAFLFVEPLDCC